VGQITVHFKITIQIFKKSSRQNFTQKAAVGGTESAMLAMVDSTWHDEILSPSQESETKLKKEVNLLCSYLKSLKT